jgi:hypothetical protein
MGDFMVGVSIAETSSEILDPHKYKASSALSSSSSPIYLSYQGGGDYRGIYEIGFKRGFIGVYRPFIECPLQDR